MSLDWTHGKVEMAHGGGGRAMTQLIDALFLPAFDNAVLSARNDQAVLPAPCQKLVVATDSHVISPLFFPGGDIGSLAVHGSLNDLALAGARPRYLTAAFILEEGFPLADLKRIAASMARAAQEAGVSIVTGDTKVVERGKADGVFITTTCVGEMLDDQSRGVTQIRPGDQILLSGTLGDHGMAVMSLREGLQFDSDLMSDTQSLHGLIEAMIVAVPDIHCMRDPTRGGVAAVLNEIASQTQLGIRLEEKAIPVNPAVQGACDLFGLDPLFVANEGKLLAFCPPEQTAYLLATMRSHPQGEQAALIGEVSADYPGQVSMRTTLGGLRRVDWLSGDPLPRIC
ncbi:MAG: hydrogenase expression/formation protein HypE [Hahellaceae bacterium]|nr:hydrogenase expression/formation protein HypE [Hahellaceae bacterium]MCP5169265.1 hydrogenase expression/formation protein HypE [Hahellaceae bacterium]